MKFKYLLLAAIATMAFQVSVFAQTNVSSSGSVPHTNTAIIPVPRTGAITNRQSQVLQRAKDAPGDYDLEFIGDSIT